MGAPDSSRASSRSPLLQRVSFIPSHWPQNEEHAEPAGGWVARGGDVKRKGRDGGEVNVDPLSAEARSQ